jgi:xanthine dehydrogenase YagS FAD-binding subunit
LAGVAFTLQFKADRIEKARVVLSGAAPVPWRSKPIEDAIVARRLNAGIVERASEAVVKNAEPLNHNGYKIPLFQGLIEEELTKISQGFRT